MRRTIVADGLAIKFDSSFNAPWFVNDVSFEANHEPDFNWIRIFTIRFRKGTMWFKKTAMPLHLCTDT